MEKRYTRRQIQEAINFWESRLNEDTHGFMRVKRTTADAKKAAMAAALSAGDPMAELVKRHEKAKLLAKKYLRNEIKDIDGNEDLSKQEKIGIWNSCIKDNHWVDSKSGYMIICATIHMPDKKGAIHRFLSNINNFKFSSAFRTCGVNAIREYVLQFLGKSYAKQVTDKTVFDGVDDPDDKNNKFVKYYCAFKLITEDTKFDESMSGSDMQIIDISKN